MIVSVYNHQQELLVTTVSLVKNTDPNATYLFYCPCCSYQIAQVQGRVAKITPGLEPTELVVVINKCPRCEVRYTFQNGASRTDWTRTTLNKATQDFRCYICRTPLLHFEHNDIWLLPVMKKLDSFPVSVVCPKNFSCPAKYYVVDAL